jgi:magnesium transporter
VLTFQERPGDVFEPIRERLRQARGHVRGRDAAYLAYALLDVIVDHYFVVLEHLADRIEQLEDAVIDDPRPDLQRTIRELHRDLVAVRKAVWPVREVVTQFQRADCSFLSDDLQPFLRDLYDHAVHTIDLVESLRELLGGLRDSYQTALGNRMNEVMKLLTIIGTIFIPLTFVVGVYGMNFDVMPELRQPLGYPVTLLGMATIAGGLLVFFRRKGWM